MLFVHDHVFIEHNNRLYTTGSLNNLILNRYIEWFGFVNVFAYKRLYAEKDRKIVKEGNESSVANFTLVEKKRSISSMISQVKEIKKLVIADSCVVSRMSILGIISVHYAKKYKKPYLIEVVADPWDSLWNHSFKGKIIAPLMVLITKYYVKNAPHVVYVTDKYLQNKYPTNGKELACSDVEININSKDLSLRMNKIKRMDLKKINLGTLANVEVPYKGQEFVIRSIPGLIKRGVLVHYYLYGAGDNTRLKEISHKLGIKDYVSFVGPVPHSNVIEKLRDLDIYIQPSLQEGLPRAVIEAMSVGLPIIGAKTGGIPELIDSDWQVNKKNIDEISNKLANLSKNDLSKAASNNFEKSFNFQGDILNQKRNMFYGEFVDYYKLKRI